MNDDRTMTVDAGVAAFIIRTLKPILAEVMVELQRDDIPDLLKDTLHKKRLSIETILHIMRGNLSTKEKNRIDRETGQLRGSDIDLDTWILLADGPNGEEEVWVVDLDEVEATEGILVARGFGVERFQVIPHTGRQIPVFWPVIGEELEEWIRRDFDSKEYYAAQEELPEGVMQ
jgi:hypothetical protein